MKFYMAPGSCSTGIHILLEKLEKIFEAYIVNIPKGDNQKPDYLSINPKGTIPTLVLEDGTSLTEFQSIAYYLAISNPKAKLLPEDPLAATKVIELMAYVLNTVHGQGFARVFATENFMQEGSSEQAIKDKGMEIVNKGFVVINEHLIKYQVEGAPFNIADAALFYVEFWADKLKIELPLHCQAHYARLREDRVIQSVLHEEGYY